MAAAAACTFLVMDAKDAALVLPEQSARPWQQLM
jgi:hypothetical protein